MMNLLNITKSQMIIKSTKAQHFVNCIAVAVQVVASDSRMIVYRPADGQSHAIRNDNLQFSVMGIIKNRQSIENV